MDNRRRHTGHQSLPFNSSTLLLLHPESATRGAEQERKLFVALVAVLLGFGILMVHSASITSRPSAAEQTFLSRHLTFVYFLHREPRQFEGGELRIHDAHLEAGRYVSEGSYQTVVPQQNQIVFFPCELLHEITPVNCPSGQFADSRFTLNGWLRR